MMTRCERDIIAALTIAVLLLIGWLTSSPAQQQQPDPAAAQSDNRLTAEQARKIAVPQLQQPDVATLQRKLSILQQHRNSIMDAFLEAETREAQLKEEIAQLKAHIQELEKGDQKQ